MRKVLTITTFKISGVVMRQYLCPLAWPVRTLDQKAPSGLVSFPDPPKRVLRVGDETTYGHASWNTSFSIVIFFHLVNGNSRIVSVKSLTPKEIKRHISLLRTSSGIKVTKLKKWWHTDNPTIQGNWNPFLNK